MDVRSRESVDEFAKNIPGEFASVDILVNPLSFLKKKVNNAGLALGVKHAHENDLVHLNVKCSNEFQRIKWNR